VTESVPPAEALFYEQGASWYWLLAGPVSAVAMALIQLSSGYGIQLLVPGIFFVLVTGFLAIQIKAARIHTSVELTPECRRHRADLPRAEGAGRAEVAVGACAWGVDGCTATTHRHRPQADQRSRRPGVGA
jgi:hypothetical protein